MHVVPHTHWDREWYHTAERFRQRLVPLIDELLDAPDLGGGSFLLDGQTIVVEDYLEVRPERASDVAAALRDGRLEAGPWFVLADELIPGGEGLIRNLLAGRRSLQRLRAESPPVLYCPDSFGHPAALPELARGFDKSLVVLWRGFGGKDSPDTDTVWWRAPSGERTLVYHLPRAGYEFGANLPAESDDVALRWKQMREALGRRTGTGVVLVPNGADHHAPQRDSAEALTALASAAGGDTARTSSMKRFAEALADAAAAADLPEIAGELRDSYGYTWTLQGTLGTRAHQKRRYAQRERELVRDVEPWTALAMLQRGRSLRSLLNVAWRPLLLCQPHDTLCGTSIDAVARAMDQRLESAGDQATGLREIAINDLLGHDQDAARRNAAQWRSVLVVRNRAARRRSGVAFVRLTLKLADVPVGPGSAHVSVAKPRASLIPEFGWPVGEPVQILDLSTANELIESPRNYPDNDAVVNFQATVWIDEAPAYGVLPLPFDRGSRPRLPEQLVEQKGRALTNGRLTIRWDAAGRLTLEDVAAERTIRSLIDWESRRDIGDLYTPAARQRKLAPRYMGTRVLHKGPLRGIVEQHWRLLKKQEHVDLRVQFILDAAAPMLRVRVAGENLARDHRLRLNIRTDVRDGVTVADAAFGPIQRKPLDVDERLAHDERPVHTAPLHRYVSQFADARGATLFSDGLAEYETLKDGFAVTVVRAVGELSRSNLPERPGHAGWPQPTPEAQCLGAFEAEFALMLHGPRSPAVIDAIERVADDVLLPLTGETLRSVVRALPTVQGVALEGEGLSLGAIKESEDGEWVVLRCVNLLDQEVVGSWQLGGMLREARLARLDETPVTPLDVLGDRVRFLAAARAVVTILVR